MENDSDMYYFQVDVDGDVLCDGAKPLLDDGGTMIGGFTLKEGSKIVCFVTSKCNQVGLFLSSGLSFFFTPKEDHTGKVVAGVLSDVRQNPTSIRVIPEQIRR
jgi:hypothetical protein